MMNVAVCNINEECRRFRVVLHVNKLQICQPPDEPCYTRRRVKLCCGGGLFFDESSSIRYIHQSVDVYYFLPSQCNTYTIVELS